MHADPALRRVRRPDAVAGWIARVAALLAVLVVVVRFGELAYGINRSVGWEIHQPAASAAGLILMGLGVVVAVRLARRASFEAAAPTITTVGAVLALLMTLAGAYLLSFGITFFPGPLPAVPVSG